MNALIQRPDALLAVRYAVMGTPQQALVVPAKAEWLRNFHRSTLHALKKRVKAAGLCHPSEVNAHHIVRRRSCRGTAIEQSHRADGARRVAVAAGECAQVSGQRPTVAGAPDSRVPVQAPSAV